MDLYTLIKFLHIGVAVAWLGGAFSVILLGTIAARQNNGAMLMSIVSHTEILAKRIFMPSSLVILALGIYLVWSDWRFTEAWIVFGIAGVVMTGAIGGAVLTPMVVKINAMSAGPDRDALAQKLLRSARADLVMLFAIVWVMVSKPAWSDALELMLVVAVIVAGGLLFLRK